MMISFSCGHHTLEMGGDKILVKLVQIIYLQLLLQRQSENELKEAQLLLLDISKTFLALCARKDPFERLLPLCISREASHEILDEVLLQEFASDILHGPERFILAGAGNDHFEVAEHLCPLHHVKFLNVSVGVFSSFA
jgi:hypothetical protein